VFPSLKINWREKESRLCANSAPSEVTYVGRSHVCVQTVPVIKAASHSPARRMVAMSAFDEGRLLIGMTRKHLMLTL
jgi:hypothetical protein